MGKQKGQSNRTKGNVRPSSSGRAANFLSESENFAGFESLSGDLGYIPVLKSLEEDKDCLVDPNFKVALIKLSKKDVTTKLRALSEFSELCKTTESGAAISVLPYWPRIYNRLSADSDRRVREAISVALHDLIKVVGKEIAPHLKSIMGCWWIAQSDSYGPASTGATKAFSSAFPSAEKQIKALNFCQDHVLDAIAGQLFTGTSAERQPNTALTADDDKDTERITATCLRAFASFLNALHSKEQQIHTAVITGLLSSSRFWKFSKHKSPDIRSAYYCVLTSMCSAAAEVLKEKRQTALKSVLCKLNEPNPIVSKALWEAADKLTFTYADWHDLVDLRKGFLPPLWGMLKSGFYGNARLVCPYLLPIVSRFPPVLDVVPVYQEFFSCLQDGMGTKVMQKSGIESRSTVTTLVECMQHIIQKTLEASDAPNWEIVNAVLQQQFLPLLQNSTLNPVSYHFVVRPLHQMLAQSMARFSKRSETSAAKDSFQTICSMIWKFIFNLGYTILDFALNEKETVIFDHAWQSYVNVLIEIKHACYEKAVVCTKEGDRVKFQDTVHAADKDEDIVNESLHKGLEDCVKDIMLHILNLQLDPCVKLDLISNLLSNFASQSLFDAIVVNKDFNCKKEFSGSSALVFAVEVIDPRFDDVVAAVNLSSSAHSFAVSLFACLQFCGDSAETYLQMFFKDKVEKCIEICLAVGEQLLQNAVPLKHWFHSEDCSFVQFLLLLAEKISVNENATCCLNGKLIRSALTAPPCLVNNGTVASLVPPAAACSVMNEILRVLNQNTDNSQFVLVYSQLICELWSNYIGETDFVELTSQIMLEVGELLIQCISSDCENDLTCLQNVVTIVLLAKNPVSSKSLDVFQEQFTTSCANKLKQITFTCEDPNAVVTRAASVFLDAFLEDYSCIKFVHYWVSALLPDEEHWLSFHYQLESKAWISEELVVKGHQIVLDGDRFDKDSVVISPAFIKCVVCLCEIMEALTQALTQKSFTDEMKRIFSLSTFQLLYLKNIFVQSVCDDQWSAKLCQCTKSWATDFPDSVTNMLEVISAKSLAVGAGWHSCLNQMLKLVNSSVIDQKLMVLKIEEPQLTENIVNTVHAYIDACSNFGCVEAVVEWIACFLLSSDSLQLETVRGDATVPLAMSLFVSALEKSFALQESQSMVDHMEAVLQYIMLWKNATPKLFLFDCDLSDCSDKMLLLNTGIARLLSLIVETKISMISPEGWDFFQCSAVSWLESVCITTEKSMHIQPNVLALLHASCQLTKVLGSFLTSQSALEDPTLPSSLATEWKEFFEPAAHSSIVTVFVLSNSLQDITTNSIFSVMQYLVASITNESLVSASSRLQPHLYPGSNIRDALQTLLYHLTRAMLDVKTCDGVLKQGLAHAFLTKVIETLFKTDDGETVNPVEIPPSFTEVLSRVEDSVVSACTSLYQEDSRHESAESQESCDEEPDSFEEVPVASPLPQTEPQKDLPSITDEEFSSIFAYLQTWRLIVSSASHIEDDVRSEYINRLSENAVTDIARLLSNLWHIMPAAPVFKDSGDKRLKAQNVTMFEVEPDIRNSAYDFTVLQHLACATYKLLLINMPFRMRTWYNGLSKIMRASVDSYTTKYVSPVVCREELRSISQSKQRQGLDIRARFVAREVIAKYEVAEADFEISVQFAPNHPLSPVQVKTVRRAGVSAPQWRYWILQMTMLLQHQNGSVVDALLIWKRKVDKRLDGLEECMICFSIVHGTNAQSLPKLECKTCRKKFHAECLYKWFDTSNQSTCPLCRAPMMFR